GVEREGANPAAALAGEDPAGATAHGPVEDVLERHGGDLAAQGHGHWRISELGIRLGSRSGSRRMPTTPTTPTSGASRRLPPIDGKTAAALAVVLAASSVLVAYFVWMVRPAAAREAVAACTGMKGNPNNPALGRIPRPAPDFTVTAY